MLTPGISFINFKKKNKSENLKKKLQLIIKEKNEILNSLSINYKDSFKKNLINKYKVFSCFRVIGMGGSILGTRAIYEFLKHKTKKDFLFVDNLQNNLIQSKKKNLNIIVSKSGNTIETIANSNLIAKKNKPNIFITENKKNYLYQLAKKLKGEIVHHNNYIGGRYSVLSEVGMLPAELMGFKSKNFRQFNSLIKNKRFLNALVDNVNSILYYVKNRKFNSIVINYDEKSESLFKWYQQLVAESLGKKKKGILPIVSNMPKDNHSVMQLYLDGFQNNFFTFFYVDENKPKKLNNKFLLPSDRLLKNKSISEIIYSQKKATENVFSKKNIPFRSFEIKKRDEKTLGELFTFFILETILLGKALRLNPYDQPAVELIKQETKKILS
tara:strand:+ start:513 stop:1664 length:1152 start_codon:yes stop_codon:yes gene_type:complete